jgi:2-(1,2-epoxy-1,2-dihydrophenyl)acetyl-CoA isomerase
LSLNPGRAGHAIEHRNDAPIGSPISAPIDAPNGGAIVENGVSCGMRVAPVNRAQPRDLPMPDPTLLYAADGGVATITLNRPDVLNAIDDSMLTLLRAALADAKADESVRALILTGAGRGFCAGADVGRMAGGGSADVAQSLRERYHPIVLAMRQYPKPIVTAVNGTAAGAGMSLALAGDIVLAAESATFLQAFSKIGLVPDCGSSWLLPRMAGDVRARALMLLAERIGAEEALRYGLVWKVHPDDRLMAEARRTAGYLASMPTRAYALIKQALVASQSNGLADQLETEALLQGQAFRTDDHREGVAAFLEKRPPQFRGR